MDGVLVNSEDVSRECVLGVSPVEWNANLHPPRVAAKVMKQLYDLDVAPEEFIPFMVRRICCLHTTATIVLQGTGEANFLGGVARKYNKPFDADQAKRAFFDLYLQIATPGSLGFPGTPCVIASSTHATSSPERHRCCRPRASVSSSRPENRRRIVCRHGQSQRQPPCGGPA